MSKKKDTKEFIKFKTNFSSKVKSRNQLFVSTKSQKSKSIICIYQKSKVEINYLYLPKVKSRNKLFISTDLHM